MKSGGEIGEEDDVGEEKYADDSSLRSSESFAPLDDRFYSE